MKTLKFATQTLFALCFASSAYATDMMKHCDQSMGADCMKKMEMMKEEMKSDTMKKTDMMKEDMKSETMKKTDMMKKDMKSESMKKMSSDHSMKKNNM